MSKKLGAATAKILIGIAKELGEGTSFFITNLVEAWFFNWGYGTHHIAPRKIYNSYASLKKGGYIEEQQRGSQKQIFLTNKGWAEILLAKIQEKRNKKKWDAKWRILVFDIPENNRKDRNFLRRQLHAMGFKELQKSVWITPYDLKEEFFKIMKLFNRKIEGDIRFVITQEISNDSDLKKYFNLT